MMACERENTVGQRCHECATLCYIRIPITDPIGCTYMHMAGFCPRHTPWLRCLVLTEISSAEAAYNDEDPDENFTVPNLLQQQKIPRWDEDVVS